MQQGSSLKSDTVPATVIAKWLFYSISIAITEKGKSFKSVSQETWAKAYHSKQLSGEKLWIQDLNCFVYTTIIPLILRDYLTYKYLLILSLIHSFNLFGRQILVTTETRQPLPYTFITHIQSGKWSQTDEYGQANISFNIMLGDSIRISRYGYHTRTLVWPDMNPHILLKVNPLQMKSVLAKGNIHPLSEKYFYQHSIEKNFLSGVENHKNILHSLPGLSLRTFGGPGSISSISINGGPTSQTRVKIGDFDLTNIQTGMTDLSQLPYPFIQSATLILPGDRLSGSGSQNGSISLKIWDHRSAISMSSGSYGHTSFHTTLSQSGEKNKSSLLIGTQNDIGNFPVQWKDESFFRENNQFSQSYGAFQSKGMIHNKIYYQLLGLFSTQSRGVPGLIWSPSSAHHQDDLQLIGTTLGWVSSYGDGKIQGLIRRSNETYIDPIYNVSSTHFVSSTSISLDQHIRMTPKLTSVIEGEIHQQDLSSTVYSKNRHSMMGMISFNWDPIQSFSFKPSYRRDYSSHLYDESTYGIIFTHSPSIKWIQSFRFNSSTHFRYPTFNDLYWEPGGNPDLNPESGIQHSFDAHVKPTRFGQLQIHLFSSETNDLIQWIPILTYWQPKNISQANRRGWTARWLWNIDSFKTLFTYSHIKTENKENKKQLRYAPNELWTLSFDWNPGFWHIHGQIHGTSSMISSYSWPEDIFISSHTLVSGSVGKTFKTSWINIISVLSVDNATNVQYESSKGYPEAGRSFRFTLTLQQKGKQI